MTPSTTTPASSRPPRRRAAPEPPSRSPRQPAAEVARGKCDSLEQEAYLHLWRTYDRLKAIEEEVFERHGLSAQQYNALRILAAASPRPLATLALAGRLVSRAPDITRLLDRLEARGLVRRDRLADNRRVVEISLTPAGSALLATLADDVVACGRRQLGHMKPADLRALIALLRAARGPHDLPVGSDTDTPAADGRGANRSPLPTGATP